MSEKNIRFSFIIPVYNVEKYLKQCVDSILTQSCTDYEIILVNDGSTDSSGALCDGFADSDSRIRVIHQQNGGLSMARNSGIRNARGEYVLFVDSDDYIAPAILEKIDKALTDNNSPDVLFLEAVKIYPDGKSEPMGDGYIAERICNRPRDEVLRHIASLPKFPGSACSKAVRRELLDDYMLFKKDLISEDIDWSYKLFKIARSYAYLPDPYYYYRQARAGSITNTVSVKKIESMFWIVENWADKNPNGVYAESLNSFVAYQYMILMLSVAMLDKKTAKAYWRRVAGLKWILSYGRSSKLRIVNTCVRLVGVKLTAHLLKIYKGY